MSETTSHLPNAMQASTEVADLNDIRGGPEQAVQGSERTLLGRVFSYQSSELRQYAARICLESPQARLSILKSPTSSIRFSYSLILEHMLDVHGRPDISNTFHDITESVSIGLKFLHSQYAQPAEAKRVLTANFVSFMAIEMLMKYYKGLSDLRGSRLSCVEHLLSNSVCQENAEDKEICIVCQYELWEVGDVVSDTGIMSRNPVLEIWLPKFIHMIVPRKSWNPLHQRKIISTYGQCLTEMHNLPPTLVPRNIHDYAGAWQKLRAGYPFFITIGRMLLRPNEPQIRRENLEQAVDQVVKVPCGHRFHRSCVFPWFMDNGTCPACRTWLLERVDILARTARILPVEIRLQENLSLSETSTS